MVQNLDADLCIVQLTKWLLVSIMYVKFYFCFIYIKMSCNNKNINSDQYLEPISKNKILKSKSAIEIY